MGSSCTTPVTRVETTVNIEKGDAKEPKWVSRWKHNPNPNTNSNPDPNPIRRYKAIEFENVLSDVKEEPTAFGSTVRQPNVPISAFRSPASSAEQATVCLVSSPPSSKRQLDPMPPGPIVIHPSASPPPVPPSAL